MNLYQEELIDHYRNPRNRGTLANPDFTSEQHNPLCGDSICLQGIIQDGRVTRLMFTGKGCVISQACASIFTQYCLGKTVQELTAMNGTVVLDLIKMDLGPVRAKCALLVFDALQSGLKGMHA